ncbi:MAG: hypothetical protein GXP25_10415, partial [Planctomycetes bacterium]|nr:hypothetical protein [Planctomycetota bacterium]
MTVNDKDRSVIRGLARRVAEIAQLPKQEERRDLWRKHNSLVKTRPPVLVRANASWQEVFPDDKLECENPQLRATERTLRQTIFQDSLNDDCIVEPWITVKAVPGMRLGNVRWGPEIKRTERAAPGGTWMFIPPIVEEEDINKLVKPHHAINEEATQKNLSMVRDVVGDILDVDLDRGPFFRGFSGDISTDSANLLGLEQLMVYMVDRPEWLHRFKRFLMEGVLTCHDEAEEAGDWSLTCGGNQAMTYSQELPDPKPNRFGVKRDRLWGFAAAQEYAWVSPAMHEEFLYNYQIPIMEKFGLVAYGCCEDLTQKLDMIKKLKNVRRIAITPQADVAASAENLKRDYVLSWRPNPSHMICNGFYPDKVRQMLTDGLEAAKGCNIDITLKDVQTIGHKPDDLREWTRIAMDVAE